MRYQQAHAAKAGKKILLRLIMFIYHRYIAPGAWHAIDIPDEVREGLSDTVTFLEDSDPIPPLGNDLLLTQQGMASLTLLLIALPEA